MSAERKQLDDLDARAFNPRAKALTDLLEEDLPVQAQHLKKRTGFGSPACGAAGGQVSQMGIGITCRACLKILAKRKAPKR